MKHQLAITGDTRPESAAASASPTFRFSDGHADERRPFVLVKPDEQHWSTRAGRYGLTGWPHFGPIYNRIAFV
jgi:hypothetical protein